MFREFEHMSTISDGASRPVQPPVVVGLGLALTSRIVRNLGGQLRVESKVGRGSKFTFILPFRLPSSNSPQVMAAPRSNIRGTQTEIAADVAVQAAIPTVLQIPRVNQTRSAPAERHHTASSTSSVSELSHIMEALGTSHMDQNSTAYSTRITNPSLLPRHSESKQAYSTSTPLLLNQANLGKVALMSNTLFDLGGAGSVKSMPPNFKVSPSAGSTDSERGASPGGEEE